jgi:hypothetical protein
MPVAPSQHTRVRAFSPAQRALSRVGFVFSFLRIGLIILRTAGLGSFFQDFLEAVQGRIFSRLQSGPQVFDICISPFETRGNEFFPGRPCLASTVCPRCAIGAGEVSLSNARFWTPDAPASPRTTARMAWPGLFAQIIYAIRERAAGCAEAASLTATRSAQHDRIMAHPRAPKRRYSVDRLYCSIPIHPTQPPAKIFASCSARS